MRMLTSLKMGQSAVVKSVGGNDKTKQFLSSLGCAAGEEITLISILAGNYIVNIKDGRYAIDRKMASAIELE